MIDCNLGNKKNELKAKNEIHKIYREVVCVNNYRYKKAKSSYPGGIILEVFWLFLQIKIHKYTRRGVVRN
ncbi:hypothetical protein DSM107003_28810 [Trichormus variabilis SAG 1403-4b]|uniref:Uncharacterized protein n=1 Tax=Trichormus variabilis SAG 1403-4b TaxID=447716 RepID=A0A433UPD4_ANAVA|nr:hypothetical protein DSM107003_28810 [Trichormus variabilis SAG 1403-4b]